MKYLQTILPCDCSHPFLHGCRLKPVPSPGREDRLNIKYAKFKMTETHPKYPCYFKCCAHYAGLDNYSLATYTCSISCTSISLKCASHSCLYQTDMTVIFYIVI